MISPKVYLPVLVSIVAAIALAVITGDKTYLVSILIGLVAGGTGVAAPPAPGVRQSDVQRLSQ
jgi:hypothetical protein